MKTVRILLVFLVIAVLVLPGMSGGALADHRGGGKGQLFVAILLGENETPPVETDAQGFSLVQLSPNGKRLRFSVLVLNIQNVVAAHIHCGAPGVAGPVVVPFFPLDSYAGEPVLNNHFAVRGSAGEADIMPVPDSEACPGGIASFADLVAKMQAGETYVNVHTEVNPTGEVRGQLTLFE